MKCKECKMENIEGALFCEECGKKLEEMPDLVETAVEGGNTNIVLATPDGSKLQIPAKDEVIIGRGRPHQRGIP